MDEIGIAVVIIALMIGLSILTSSITCHSKAAALNYRASYAPFQGCVLIKRDGSKVLLEQLREFSVNEY